MHPESHRKQGGRQRKDGSSCLSRESNEGRVHGKEEGKNERGARADLLTEEERGKHKRGSNQGRPEPGKKIKTAEQKKQDRREIGVCHMGTEHGASPLCDLQGIQRELSF